MYTSETEGPILRPLEFKDIASYGILREEYEKEVRP